MRSLLRAELVVGAEIALADPGGDERTHCSADLGSGRAEQLAQRTAAQLMSGLGRMGRRPWGPLHVFCVRLYARAR